MQQHDNFSLRYLKYIYSKRRKRNNSAEKNTLHTDTKQTFQQCLYLEDETVQILSVISCNKKFFIHYIVIAKHSVCCKFVHVLSWVKSPSVTWLYFTIYVNSQHKTCSLVKPIGLTRTEHCSIHDCITLKSN